MHMVHFSKTRHSGNTTGQGRVSCLLFLCTNARAVIHNGNDRITDPSTNAQFRLFVRELKREAASQLGTVGSGNHYVDVFEAEHDGGIWVGVHFGSRGLGHKIASHYTKLAGGKNGI